MTTGPGQMHAAHVCTTAPLRATGSGTAPGTPSGPVAGSTDLPGTDLPGAAAAGTHFADTDFAATDVMVADGVATAPAGPEGAAAKGAEPEPAPAAPQTFMYPFHLHSGDPRVVVPFPVGQLMPAQRSGSRPPADCEPARPPARPSARRPGRTVPEPRAHGGGPCVPAMSITDTLPRMIALTEQLQESGAIRTPVWTSVFSVVPRHVFVPRVYEPAPGGAPGAPLWQQHEHDDGGWREWLDAVYRDTAPVTALGPRTARRTGDRLWAGTPAARAVRPALAAAVLEGLEVEDGHVVLEAGTRSGYTAALLCARLGDRAVDCVGPGPDRPDRLERIRRRLAATGFAPRLGVRAGAGAERYDRVVSVRPVRDIPAAWTGRTRPGGIVAAPLDLGLLSAPVRLTVEEDGTARGAFTAVPHGLPPAALPGIAPTAPPALAVSGKLPTGLAPRELLDAPGFLLLLALVLPGAALTHHLDPSGLPALRLTAPDGSWASLPLTAGGGDDAPSRGTAVTLGGDPGVWRRAENAWDWWLAQGRPDPSRYGVVRHPDGLTEAWYLPDGRRWRLGAGAGAGAGAGVA
jgi:protein-L-isoaspartate O-methyltransferase